MQTIDQQIEAMAAQWPLFAVIEREGQRATWEGLLAPDKREHLVRVRYRVPHLLENFRVHDMQPRVQVAAPLLERHPDYEQGPIPHVYVNDASPELPYLCLFDSAGREWSGNDLIAHTTIFWTWEWLYFYEGWLVTKKWKGGGRHNDRPAQEGKRIASV